MSLIIKVQEMASEHQTLPTSFLVSVLEHCLGTQFAAIQALRWVPVTEFCPAECGWAAGIYNTFHPARQTSLGTLHAGKYSYLCAIVIACLSSGIPGELGSEK